MTHVIALHGGAAAGEPRRIYTAVTKARQIQVPELLDNYVQALDSAMLVAQTAAEKGPVHKLRTTTRRVEAQLVLLDRLPGLPEHAKESAEVHRLLKRVRRAAAAVRDLDVQVELIANDLPDKAAVHEGTVGDEIRRQGRKLMKRLEKRRKTEATGLVATLRSESEDLAAAMRKLQKTMEPEEESGAAQQRRTRRGFSAGDLNGQIQQWFRKRTDGALQSRKRTDQEHALQRLQHLDEETLHDLRKAAKQCRYMAEGLPEGSSTAKKLAQRFEYLQEAGGHWHDWLMLEQMASRVHGKKAALTERYRHHRDAALAEYHLQLALEFTTGLQRGHPLHA